GPRHGRAAGQRATGAARAGVRGKLLGRRAVGGDGRGFARAETRMSTLFEELSRVRTYDYTEEDVAVFEALHEEIRALKKQRNAVIVAHNYYRPEILKVADFV